MQLVAEASPGARCPGAHDVPRPEEWSRYCPSPVGRPALRPELPGVPTQGARGAPGSCHLSKVGVWAAVSCPCSHSSGTRLQGVPRPWGNRWPRAESTGVGQRGGQGRRAVWPAGSAGRHPGRQPVTPVCSDSAGGGPGKRTPRGPAAGSLCVHTPLLAAVFRDVPKTSADQGRTLRCCHCYPVRFVSSWGPVAADTH